MGTEKIMLSNKELQPISVEKKSEVFDIYKMFLVEVGVSLKDKNIADFGCAKGIFLQDLHETNVLHGYDISEEAINTCRKKFQKLKTLFNVLDLDQSSPAKEMKYDLVTFFDVIEHLKNFTHLKNILQYNIKSGGYVVITTPNANSFVRVLGFAKIYSGEADPTHTMLFTPYTLDFFLRRCGLKKVTLCTPYVFHFKNNATTKRILLGGQIFAVYQKVS